MNQSRAGYRSTDLVGRGQQGVTLVELVTAMLIVAVLAAIALPGMTDFLTSMRLRNCATDLMSSLLLARSEAIKRNALVAVKPDGAWSQGWTVTTVATNEQLDRKNALGYRVQINLAPGAIVYDSNGRLAATTTAKIEFADTSSLATARCVSTDLSGLPKLTQGTCS